MKTCNSEYKIVKTKLLDDTVRLKLSNCLDDEFKVYLSVDDYFKYKLKENSLISKDVLDEIQENEPLVLAYRSALRRLAIRDYSSKKMADSLKQKYNLTNYQIDLVITKLKKANLLNDQIYTSSKIDLFKDSLLSKKAIYSKLIKDGIDKEIIDKYYVEQDEFDKAFKKASKYQASIKNKSLNLKKQTIVSKLVNDGFSLEDAKLAINKLNFKDEIESEDDVLRKHVQKAYNRYHNKYEGYELKNHIYNYLASKGFNLDSINKVINEMEY